MVFGSIADIFFQWQYYGVFEFVLPFLLVFAIVYGILSSTRFFGDNRGVYVVVAVAIGLMSLAYTDLFTAFISQLFPRLGVGLAIMLAMLILAGMFINQDEQRYWGWGLATIAAVIVIVIVYQSFDSLNLAYGFFGNSDTIGFIVLAILIAGVIIAVGASGGKDRENKGGAIQFLPQIKPR